MPSTGSTGRSGPATEAPTDETRTKALKALSHPLRILILGKLRDDERSPGGIADEIGAALGVVSYHVRMLRDYECVELVRTEPRRGALQHFYRATAIGQEMHAMTAGIDEPLLDELRAARDAVVDHPANAIDLLNATIARLEAKQP